MLLRILIVLFVIFCIGAIIYYLFPPVKVCGRSMYPTYQDDTILLTTRCFLKYVPGEVYIYNRKEDGDDRVVVKRLKDVITQEGQVYLYFEGDNPEESYDSRYYGYVHHSYVMLKVVKVLKY